MTHRIDPRPALEIARARAMDRAYVNRSGHVVSGSASLLARELGVSSRAIERYKKGGTMSKRTADMVAVEMGLHPALIWEDWYDCA